MAKRRSAADYMSVIYAQDDFSEFLNLLYLGWVINAFPVK